MHKHYLDFIEKTFERYGEMTVRLVAFPVPPAPVENFIFMPDSFNPKTYEQMNVPKEFRIVFSKPSPFGPALLCYVKLKHLIGFKRGYLGIVHSTFCANVSYYKLFSRDDGLTYVDDVVLDSITDIRRSCNPNSHFTVPKAPYLTAMLQYAQAPNHTDGRVSVYSLMYSAPEDAEKVYSQCDFSDNIEIDEYVSKCVINPEVRVSKLSAGLDVWGDPYIKTLRRNAFLMEADREHLLQRR
jgi:hypothetical protein